MAALLISLSTVLFGMLIYILMFFGGLIYMSKILDDGEISPLGKSQHD